MNFNAFQRNPWLRRSAYGVVALCLLSALLWTLAAALPQWLQQWAQTQASQELGRKVTLASLAIDWRKSSITLNELRVAHADGTGQQLYAQRIDARIQWQALLDNVVALEHLTIEAPQLQLGHTGAGHYDIDDVVQRLLAPSPQPSRFALRLQQLSVANGGIDFHDLHATQKLEHRIRKLHFTLPFYTTETSTETSAQAPDVQPQLRFELNGSRFDSSAQGQMFSITPQGTAKLTVHQLNLAPYLPYLPSGLPVRIREGLVDAQLEMRFGNNPKPTPTPTSSATPASQATSASTPASTATPARTATATPQRLQWSVTGSINASRLVIGDAQGQAFLKIKGLNTVLGELRPLEQQLQLKTLDILGPQLELERKPDGTLTNTWSSPAASTATPTTSTASSTTTTTTNAPWKIDTMAINLREGHISWKDSSVQPAVAATLAQLQLQTGPWHWPTPESHSAAKVPTQPAMRKLQFSAAIQSPTEPAGQITFDGQVAPASAQTPLKIEGNFSAHRIATAPWMPYLTPLLKERTQLQLTQADLQVDGKIQYTSPPQTPNISNTPTLHLSGSAAVENLRITNKTATAATTTASNNSGSSPAPVLHWKSLSSPQFTLQIAPNSPSRLQISSLTLSDWFAQLTINPKGHLELRDWLTAPNNANSANNPNTPNSTGPTDKAKSALSDSTLAKTAASLIEIGPIALRNGRIAFSDQYIQPAYNAQLSELQGSISAYSNQASPGSAAAITTIALHGLAQGNAALDIQGQISPLLNPDTLDIRAKVDNLSLSPLSAYAAKYAGYGIENGLLNVDLHYTLKPDGTLTATNQIRLKQLSFGNKVENPIHSLPVKLAVFLLADRHGIINLNLPVNGSLNDPQFSIWPVVWQGLGNLITKAITAPFSLFMNSSSSEENLSTIGFEPGSSTLSPTAQAQLNTLGQTLATKPALTLTITANASLEHEKNALARLRSSALPAAQSGAPATPSSTPAPALAPPANRTNGNGKKPANAQAAPVPAAPLPITSDDITALAQQRAKAVRDHLASNPDIAPEQLRLGSINTTPALNKTTWTPTVELGLGQR